jgi:predicted ATPase
VPRKPPPHPSVGYGSPFLTRVEIREDRRDPDLFPFTLPLFQGPFAIDFPTPVTFLVGENGSGKSSLLEALAWSAGFNTTGGNRDHRFSDDGDGSVLGKALRLGWKQKVTTGFFLRAETFFNFASHLESLGSDFRAYGGQSLQQMSHGEAFLALFRHRFDDGFYLLDEPEAALSPQRQLAFLGILHELATSRAAQFVIATHSPILLTLPGATVYSLDGGQLQAVPYAETEHFRLTRDFLNAPERYFRHLFAGESDHAGEE